MEQLPNMEKATFFQNYLKLKMAISLYLYFTGHMRIGSVKAYLA